MKTQARIVITGVNDDWTQFITSDIPRDTPVDCTFHPAGTVIPMDDTRYLQEEDVVQIINSDGNHVSLRLSSLQYTIEHIEPIDRTPDITDEGVAVSFRFDSTSTENPRFAHCNRDVAGGDKVYSGKLYKTGETVYNSSDELHIADEDMLVFTDDVGDTVTNIVRAFVGLTYL